MSKIDSMLGSSDDQQHTPLPRSSPIFHIERFSGTSKTFGIHTNFSLGMLDPSRILAVDGVTRAEIVDRYHIGIEHGQVFETDRVIEAVKDALREYIEASGARVV